jgi:hypothetical protein
MSKTLEKRQQSVLLLLLLSQIRTQYSVLSIDSGDCLQEGRFSMHTFHSGHADLLELVYSNP